MASRTWIHTTCIILLSTAMTASSARAAAGQTQDPSDLTRVSLDELLGMEVDQVYSASRFVQDVRHAPAAVTIVTAADIRRFGYTTLADALRSVTGLYTTSDRNYTYLGVRGFGLPGDYNSRVLVLIDGFRFNDGVYIRRSSPPSSRLISRSSNESRSSAAPARRSTAATPFSPSST